MWSPFDLLPIWQEFQAASNQLKHVHCLRPNAQRLDYWSGAEMHHVPTLLLCLSGSLRLTYERDQRLDLQQYDMAIIGPGVFHQHSPIKRGCMQFQLGFSHHGSDVHFQSHEHYFLAMSNPQTNRKIIRSILNNKHASTDECRESMHTVLNNVLRNPLREQNSVPQAYTKMFAYFVAQVYNGASVNDIIAASGLSRSHAYALFTTYNGMPLRESIAEHRINMARLLMAGELSLTEIAERSGFSSLQQMTRLFQKKHKCTPRDWRYRQYS